MTAPAVFIRLELEHRRVVAVDARDDGEQRRLLDWLGQHPDYLRLVAEAQQLASERPAA